MTKMRVDNQDFQMADIFLFLLDNFPDIIHSVDNDGNIVFTNKRAEMLLGYTRDELLKMNIRQLYAEEVLHDMEKGFRDLKEAGTKSVESVVKDRHGNLIPVEIRSFAIYDDNGQFIRTFSILRDIRPLKELQNSLVHAGRLAAIGEMASSIMHDVANPLTVIIAADSLLMARLEKMKAMEGCDDARDWAREIERAALSIEKLVQHMRQFVRAQPDPVEWVDLAKTVDDALFITQNKLHKFGVNVTNHVKGGRHYVRGRTTRLEQVFINLITNACDAMEGQPKRELTLTINALTLPEGPFWKCDVADTGAGIPPEIQTEIFRPFFTTKDKSRGTGLGLSIVRGIVKDHKGDVHVASEPGAGSVFSVLLPCETPGESPAPAAG